jgi:cytochrome c oxidase assembly protein subunit 15
LQFDLRIQRSPSSASSQWIGAWLLVVAAMVFIIIAIGGLTRLTHSGLSMVDWQPITGWFPPFTDAAWEAAFRAYQQFPEYRKLNAGMTLSEFKGIFWLEYIHRLWGRLIGVVFLLPFLYFLAVGWLRGRLGWRLALLLLLGGLQGALGWYMVKSGLVDRPDVSQYRLVAHFGAGLALYGFALWTALEVLTLPVDRRPQHPKTPAAIGLASLVFVTALSGGFVAGLDAGLVYNEFPLMGGRLIPPDAFPLQPLHLNFFEDVTTVQLTHRWLAVTTVVAILLFRWRLQGGSARACRVANGFCVVALTQLGLGISTLILGVPVLLASLHQMGAVVLWSLALWMAFELRFQPGDRAERIPAQPLERAIGDALP